jgi:hypothetical protein
MSRNLEITIGCVGHCRNPCGSIRRDLDLMSNHCFTDRQFQMKSRVQVRRGVGPNHDPATSDFLLRHLSFNGMASLIAILDVKGKPLIQRSYRDDVPPSFVERFLPLVLDIEEEGQQVTPCFSSQGINYMHIRHSNLYRELSEILL